MSDEEKPNVPTRGKAPVFLDGRTTHKSYLCIGVRNGEDGHNAVGVKHLGGGDYKLHFWPNAAFFDVDLGDKSYFRRSGGCSHGAYEGSVGNWDHVKSVLEQLAAKEGTSVAPLDKVIDVLQVGFNPNRHFTA